MKIRRFIAFICTVTVYALAVLPPVYAKAAKAATSETTLTEAMVKDYTATHKIELQNLINKNVSELSAAKSFELVGEPFRMPVYSAEKRKLPY